MAFIESLYSVALPIHIVGVFITLAIVFASALYGLLWVTGKKEVLKSNVVGWLHTLVWIGLFTSIISGAIMFIPYREYLLAEFVFRLKLLFVAFLVLNAFVINSFMSLAYTQSFVALSRRTRLKLLLSGMVSITGWIGSFVSAHFI